VVIAAVRTVLDDLVHGRVPGKVLGSRHVSGDLTGPASVKIDVPHIPTRRFRLVLGFIDPTTLAALAIGVRDEHAIYRLAVDRFGTEHVPGASDDNTS